MAGGGGGGGGGSGKGHQQATPEQIAELRKLLSGLETKNAYVARYRWFTTDRVLHRFITARNGNVSVALNLLLEHLEWRVSYKMDTILDDDLSGAGVSHEFYWSGFDREGRPCLVFRAAEHRKADSDGAGPTNEDKVRYYCQLLERGFRDFAPAHKFCLILDCRGAGMNIMDRKLFRVATPIIENNFPETQHATYVLPCNGVITMAWKAISAFLDPGTADKIRLVKDFDDPALAKAFTPETLKAFVSLDPSIAPPQPHVAPDPLAFPAPPSEPTVSLPRDTVRDGSSGVVHPRKPLPSPSSDTLNSNGGNGVSTRLSAATLPPPAANLLSEAGLPAPYSIGSGNGVVGGVLGGRVQQQQQSLLPQRPRPSAATPGLAGAALETAGAGGDDDHSSGPLPPPSPGGSTAFGGGNAAGPSPSGSSLPLFQERPGDSPAGAVAAAAPAAVAAGAAPPSPSGSNLGPDQAAPPSPTGDSLSAASVTGGGGGGNDGTAFDERRRTEDIRGNASGLSNGGSNGLVSPTAGTMPGSGNAGGDGDGIGWTRPPSAAAAAAAIRGGTAAAAAGGGSSGRGDSLDDAMQQAIARTVEFTERKGVLYKRRDTLRGRFAFRQKYAVLRFPPSSAGARARGSTSSSSSSPTPPPTLTLLKGRGKHETEKVVSLEGAEVTLGTVMIGELYPFVISFPAPRKPVLQQQQQRLGLQPLRRNTDDFVFTGVLDADAGGGGDGGFSGGDAHAAAHAAAHADFSGATAGRDGAESNGGSGSGSGVWSRNSLPPPHSLNAVSTSTSTLTSPYVRPPSNANSNSSSSERGASYRSVVVAAEGALRTRKTLRLACDSQEKTLQWARWLADAVARHEAAADAAAAAAGRSRSGSRAVVGDPWELVYGHNSVSAGYGTGSSAAAGGWRDGASAAAASGEGTAESLGQQGAAAERLLAYGSSEVTEALVASSMGEGRPPARPGGGAPTGKTSRFNLDAYRRSKANLHNNRKGATPLVPGATPSRSRLARKNSLGDSLRRVSTPSLLAGKGRSGGGAAAAAAGDNSNYNIPGKANTGTSIPTFSPPSSSSAAGAVLKGLGEAGGALMSMRDTEISRLRKAYARSELSREDMKGCLRTLAVQLREEEDRAGALMAEREAALLEIDAKEAELTEKEALLQERAACAETEAKQKEELVSSLQVENEALQAAVERLRHDFQEERTLRLSRMKTKSHEATAAAAAAAASASTQRAPPPSTPSRHGTGLGILGRARRANGTMAAATAAATATAAGGGIALDRPHKTPTRNGGGSSGISRTPGLHNHHARTPRRARRFPLGSAAMEAAAVAMTEWDSTHGGIGSRHNVGAMAVVTEERSKEEGLRTGEGPPWVLNTDQTWAGEARPPHDVLVHLLDELEDVKEAAGATAAAAAADSPDGTALAPPPEEEREEDGGSEKKEEVAGDGGGGHAGKVFVANTEAFVQWSHRTGELQMVPPLESVDLPGEKDFTEGCLELLREHAAIVLHKEPEELTAREEARMAYAIGDGMYTITQDTPPPPAMNRVFGARLLRGRRRFEPKIFRFEPKIIPNGR
ncbi:unnamed protein product [Pylaiella littoralis]